MSFQSYHEAWLDQLRQLLNELDQSLREPPTAEHHHLQLSQLVDKTMSHFTEYYTVKGLYAKEDILSIIKSPWSTSFERAFHWVAGWRPITAFHLIYTEASIRFESQMINMLQGCRNGDIGDLSSDQFSRVSELQCETVLLENAISDELSQWQDGVGELIALQRGLGNNVTDEKMEQLVSIIEKADNLRLKTIESLTYLFNPRQAVEFLIAAIELHIGVQSNFNRTSTGLTSNVSII